MDRGVATARGANLRSSTTHIHKRQKGPPLRLLAVLFDKFGVVHEFIVLVDVKLDAGVLGITEEQITLINFLLE